MGDLRSAEEEMLPSAVKASGSLPNYSENQDNSSGESERTRSRTFLQAISISIQTNLENFFFRYGYTVATHPFKFITISLLFTVICASGFYNFQQEVRPDKLILPDSSDYSINTAFLRKQVPVPIRENNALITADNILVPGIMKILLDLHEMVKNLTTADRTTWNDICFRIPISKFERKRRRRSADRSEENDIFGYSFSEAFSDDFFNDDNSTEIDDWDPYANVPEDVYCSIVNGLDDGCMEINPVEYWSFDRSKIENLTQEQVIWFFNHQLESPVFGRSVNFTQHLGGKIVRNEKGEIISAESMLLQWAVKVDKSEELVADKQGQLANAKSLIWEKVWLNAMTEFSANLPENVRLDFYNFRSWGDISQEILKQEMITLAAGYGIMFIYVGMMLGKLNMVEQRPYLTGAGLISVLFAIVVSCGISSMLGIPFMMLNRILPFLLLGIGIDDMFVIMQCWNNLFPCPLSRKSKLTIPERMGFALKHAGVSVTVTSLTDVAAFGAGSLTTFPSLRSFCLYAAIGIIALFIFQTTFFVACFAIDQKRLEERRNAYFFWIKYDEDKFIPNSNNSKSYCQMFFDKILSKYLLNKFVMAIVVIITGTFFGFGIYGNTLLIQKFDPVWFLPEDSHLSKYVQSRIDYFPELGYASILVAHEVNWSESLNHFGEFVDDFHEATHFIHGFDEFFTEFKNFSMKYYGLDISKPMSPKKLNKYMGKYLYSPTGARYRYFFTFNESFACGEDIPHITTIIIPFRFKFLRGLEEHLPALRWIKSITKNANLTFNDNTNGKFFYWSSTALGWEIDEIIKDELYRNLALSLTCVMVATLLLLADFKLCLLTGACVVLTIVNVSGFMHFWGLTIESASCTILILAVGLCVDYAAHICLEFMKCRGTRTQRAQQSLRNIGPAVFNGGFSTFLGVILLANAQTVVVGSFFKIFTLVVFFGLFHGLIFLPVLLTMFGSEPQIFENEDDEGQFKKGFGKSDGNAEKKKVVEMYPLSNGSLHAKEIEARSPESNVTLSAVDPLLIVVEKD